MQQAAIPRGTLANPDMNITRRKHFGQYLDFLYFFTPESFQEIQFLGNQ
jgi:hypothetical protein